MLYFSYYITAIYIENSIRNIINFAFKHPTYFKDLKRKRVHYIYPDICHFCCSSFIFIFKFSFKYLFPSVENFPSNSLRVNLLAPNSLMVSSSETKFSYDLYLAFAAEGCFHGRVDTSSAL